jgi:hypothetical protein
MIEDCWFIRRGQRSQYRADAAAGDQYDYEVKALNLRTSGGSVAREGIKL